MLTSLARRSNRKWQQDKSLFGEPPLARGLIRGAMDGVLLAEHLLKSIQERRQRISEMMTGGNVKDMEEYKQLVGNIESLDYIGHDLRDLLEKAD